MSRNIRRSRRLSFTGLLASFLITSPAQPWVSKGHEIVAAIAETHLTDSARKRIRELLPPGTTQADASTWPDKAGRQNPDMDPYHFINFPKDANTYDQQRDCKLRNCLIEAIAWYVQVLKSPDAPSNEKRMHFDLSLTQLAIFINRFMPGSQKIAEAPSESEQETASSALQDHFPAKERDSP